MKVGIVGAGAVGAASLLSLVMRSPPACEIVVLDKNNARAGGGGRAQRLRVIDNGSENLRR